LVQYMEKKFNVTIVPKFVSWSDFVEKYNLWATSGELPDFFVTDLRFRSTYRKWIDQGVIRALPENLKHYTHLERLINQKDLVYLKESDGKNYFLPRVESKYDELKRGILVRKDWMENLGIDDPNTWEEFKSMLRKFVAEDPNGTGVDDTYGLVPRTSGFMDTLYLTLFPTLAERGYWFYENGQWQYPLLAEQMQQVITELNLLYREKLLDADFLLLNTFTAGAEKFAAGNVGALLAQVDPPRLKIAKDLWEQANPDKDFFASVKILETYPFPAENGTTYKFTIAPIAWSETYFNAELSDSKMDRILNILNFLFSEEGQNIWYRGFEGVDYKLEDGKFIDIRQAGSDGQKVKIAQKYPSSLFWGGMAYWGNDLTFTNNDEINYEKFGKGLVDMSRNYIEALATRNAKRPPVDFRVNRIGSKIINEAEIVMSRDDIINESIIADKPWEKFQSLMQEYLNEGLNDVVTKVNEELSGL
ncbi:MAG: extracellular solute-binding protein, partial [Spirochaetota bacterium]